MSIEFQSVRASLVEKRDALSKAIEALDAVMGLHPPEAALVVPRRVVRRLRRLPGSKIKKAAKRNERTNERTKQGPGRRVARSLPKREATDLVKAREDAILTGLKRQGGMATSKVLRAMMPKESELNDDQRDAAYRNTLTKLKQRGVIGRTGDTWSTTGA